MTTTDHLSTTDVTQVTFDLYRDIHKGIRTELFAVTSAAGCLDPGDRIARASLADQVGSVAELLEQHARHEDEAIDPVLETHLPALAERISTDHVILDRRIATIVDMASSAVDAPAQSQRALLHAVYLDLGSFVSAYLEHQDTEERVVMPALEQAVGVNAVVAIHGAILSSIAPDDLMRSLALMLPAMNVDDRCEMLGGMRATAPPEAFNGVVSLAQSALHPADFAAIVQRLGL